jgi:hypothetical protein
MVGRQRGAGEAPPFAIGRGGVPFGVGHDLTENERAAHAGAMNKTAGHAREEQSYRKPAGLPAKLARPWRHDEIRSATKSIAHHRGVRGAVT